MKLGLVFIFFWCQAVSAFEHADKIARLHAELLRHALHRYVGILLKELGRPAHPQLQNVLLGRHAVAGHK
ncbi:hypothetical protein D3C77_583620 [compost metagenome]